jgi:hypothetical protein
MKKRLLINLMLVITGMLALVPLAWGETTSEWFGPYGNDRPGVFYRYQKDSWASDYNSVQFENRNSVKVKIDYVTNDYPNTWYTLYLDSNTTQDPAAAIVQGDRLKVVRVTAQ